MSQRQPFATAERSRNWYRTPRWKVMAKQQLAVEPCCRLCRSEGLLVQASIVDHVVPHRGDEQAFFNSANLQSLCRRHSNIKTAHEVAQRYDRKRQAEPHPGLMQ